MNFFSIKEFFYKLNTIGFILLLVPMIAFIFSYYLVDTTDAIVSEPITVNILLSVAALLFFADLTTVHLLWRFRMRKLKLLSELANRMDGYFWFTLIKMSIYSTFSLLMATGFYLTGNFYFTLLFILTVIAVAFQWPSRSSFCMDMELRGTEYDMVMRDMDLPGRG